MDQSKQGLSISIPLFQIDFCQTHFRRRQTRLYRRFQRSRIARMQVVACWIDAPLVQPSKIGSGGIRRTGCGRAFFGDDAGGFGFVQIRADAFYVGMDFLCPFLAFKRTDMVGNADDGGDFVCRQTKCAAIHQPLRRTIGKSGQRRADGRERHSEDRR